MVISDADGTLLENGRLTNPLLFSRMVKTLSRAHIPLAVASGRSAPVLRNLFSPYADQMLFFSLDGTYCTFGDKVLFRAPIPPKTTAKAILHALDRKDILGIEFCCGEHSYLLSPDPELHKSEQKRIGAEYAPLTALPGEPITKIIYFTHRMHPRPLPLPEGLHAVYENGIAVECVRDDADKLLAAKTVCEALHIDLGDVIAFGDGENDRSLLTAVGTPVTMIGAPYPIFSITKNHTMNVAEYVLDRLTREQSAAERK